MQTGRRHSNRYFFDWGKKKNQPSDPTHFDRAVRIMLVDPTNMIEGQNTWVKKRRIIILQHNATRDSHDLHKLLVSFSMELVYFCMKFMSFCLDLISVVHNANCYDIF
jgi:hypothetical protein